MNFDLLAVRHLIAPLLLAAVANSAGGQSNRPDGRTGWTLEQIIAATAQHPLVAAAQARLEAARGSRRTAGALPNPVAAYQIEDAPFPGRRAPEGLTSEVAATLTLPIEALYQRAPRVRQAEEGMRAAESEIVAVRRAVALDASRAFYRVALAQFALQAAVENREGLGRLMSYNEKRVAEGISPEGDLLRVRVERDRAATEAVLAEVELARARAALRPYLSPLGDADSVDSLNVNAMTGTSIATPPPLSVLVTRARQCRPELVTARARVAAAAAETSIQRALTIRQVGATFGQKRVGSETSMIAGLSVPIPLFDRNRGEVQRASAERLAAEKELEWAERSITSELAGAHQAATLVSAEVARLGGSFLERADEVRRITLAAYEDGAASLLQVLDASRTLNDARLGYYRAVFAEQQNVLELSVASGAEPGLSFTSTAPGAGCVRRDAGRGANQ